MGVSGFARAWLTWEDCGERRSALHELLKRGLHIVEGVEAIHAFSATAEFAGSLRPTQKQDGEDSSFAAIEVKNFLQTVLVFLDSTVCAAGRSGESIFLETGKCFADRILVEAHDGLAIRLLIAGIHQSVQGKRIVLGRGDVFLDESTEHTGLCRIQKDVHGLARMIVTGRAEDAKR